MGMLRKTGNNRQGLAERQTEKLANRQTDKERRKREERKEGRNTGQTDRQTVIVKVNRVHTLPLLLFSSVQRLWSLNPTRL